MLILLCFGAHCTSPSASGLFYPRRSGSKSYFIVVVVVVLVVVVVVILVVVVVVVVVVLVLVLVLVLRTCQPRVFLVL